MTLGGSSERLEEALLRAQARWQGQQAASTEKEVGGVPIPSGVTVALSREMGTHCHVVAARLGEKLGWPLYDRELLQRIAEEMGLRTSLIESLDERHSSWLLESFQAFGSAHPVSEGAFIYHLVRVVLALAARGNCIIVGRGAALLLPPATTLRVRLVAPLPDRIRVVQEQHKLSHDEAARRIQQTDDERDRFLRDHFLKDPTDPANFDLVLSSARFSPDECVDLIVQALGRIHAPAPAR